MEHKKTEHKIILDCTKQGIIKQLFLDSASLLGNIELPISIHSLVSPESINELGRFWISIQENHMEEDTILTLNHDDKKITFKFSGYLLKESILLCGKTELTTTEKALEEIMVINNEQANQIRLIEKKADKILSEIEKKEINEDFLNDFSAINNELINNKRELMRNNQKIELLNQELYAVNENLTSLTYSISHDLREPVRMINSFLTLLNVKYGKNLDEKGQTYLDLASDGANRLSKMLEDLLTYHQSTNFNTTESVDLNVVFLEVKKILHNQIKVKNAQVTSDDLPTLIGSSTGFLQIFQNLISNAIKFVPEGKTPIVSICVEENEINYTLVIKDNGIGIPKNQKQNVFDMFKRLNSKQHYEGTGMGLAMVKKSVERMGGEIWLESEEGKGSTFYIAIPKMGNKPIT